MRSALWRLVGAVLIVLGVFAGGIGAYAVSQALWPLLVVWWPWLLAGAVAVVALGAWWLWWRLPKRQMRSITAADPKARADIEDNFRKTIGQLLGGAAVLIGAGFAYLQFIQQQRASHDLLISNQVSKGFEQLGSAIESVADVADQEILATAAERYTVLRRFSPRFLAEPRLEDFEIWEFQHRHFGELSLY